MKILRITAQGLPLFKKDLDICFYTQQRVCEEDKDSLYRLTDNYYLHSACAFIGINASGKTSVLKVISLALNIVKNEPINHVEAKSILGGAKNVTIRTYFYDKRSYVCCLETVIAAKKSKTGEYVYSILSESLWEKPIATVKSKKYLTDFTKFAWFFSRTLKLIICSFRMNNQHFNFWSSNDIYHVNFLLICFTQSKFLSARIQNPYHRNLLLESFP